MQLVDDHADLHLLRLADVDAAGRARAFEVLSADERERAARFVFERDRDLYTCAHGFLRLTLARYLGGDARDLRFAGAPGERPELDTAGPPPLRFNLSHTHGLVGCVVARTAACGVDVERRGRVDPHELLDTVLAPGERADLLALDDAGQRERFIEIWTLKEAFLKGQGVGLSRPLQGVAFSGLEGPAGAIRCAADDGAAWRFWSGAPTAEHRAAVALRTEGRPATFAASAGTLARA
jgi:4'-phosphopantetheinyl transferase